jgi:hypothetical protein
MRSVPSSAFLLLAQQQSNSIIIYLPLSPPGGEIEFDAPRHAMGILETFFLLADYR